MRLTQIKEKFQELEKRIKDLEKNAIEQPPVESPPVEPINTAKGTKQRDDIRDKIISNSRKADIKESDASQKPTDDKRIVSPESSGSSGSAKNPYTPQDKIKNMDGLMCKRCACIWPAITEDGKPNIKKVCPRCESEDWNNGGVKHASGVEMEKLWGKEQAEIIQRSWEKEEEKDE